jgi:hypothetical protein
MFALLVPDSRIQIVLDQIPKAVYCGTDEGLVWLQLYSLRSLLEWIKVEISQFCISIHFDT